MSRKITLSIVIVNYNTEKFIFDCLKSVMESNYPKDKMEIFVIDNHSRVNPGDLFQKQFPMVNFLQNDRNEGFAKANNSAIDLTRGDFVLLLNPDTLFKSNVLKVMVEFMKNNSKAAVATPRIALADGSIDDSCHRGFPTPWNAFCHFSGLGSVFPGSSFFNGYHLGYKQMQVIHEIDSCSGAFMLIRRKAGRKVGWLDEDYFWYGEDLDFCFRIKKKGWKIFFVPTVKVVHLKGVSSGIKKHSREIASASVETRKIATKARFEVMRIFYAKHYSNKYPKIVKDLIYSAIRYKERLTTLMQKNNKD